MAYLQNKQLSDLCKYINIPWPVTTLMFTATYIQNRKFPTDNNVKYGINYVYWSIIFYVYN